VLKEIEPCVGCRQHEHVIARPLQIVVGDQLFVLVKTEESSACIIICFHFNLIESYYN
jgi:hypothetical protein